MPGAERALGPWRSWALVVGSTIGSAIFLMPAVLAPYGGLGLASWAVAGLGALFVALMFASLSRRVTAVGGPYAYARAGFGDFAGFLIAWGYWITCWSACAAIAIAFTSYLGVLIPAVAASPVLSAGIGLILIWSLVVINILGVKEAGVVGLVTTMLKLIPLLFIGIIGLFFVQRSILPPLNPGTGSSLGLFASSFALTFWTFVGFEVVTVPAEDVADQQNTIPRALVTGIMTVTVVYLLVALAVNGIVPNAELKVSASPLADAGRRIAGNLAGTLVAVGAMVSTLGCINCTVLACGQTAMAAGRDGVFPARFQRLSRYRTPGFSLVVAGVLMSALLLLNYSKGLVGAYTFIILIATLTSVVPYAFCAMASLVLAPPRRLRESAVAVVSFLVCMWVIASATYETVYWTFLLLIAGLPIYVVVTRRSRSVA
jgi:basic amino acid/polyamine antiporter, APA family